MRKIEIGEKNPILRKNLQKVENFDEKLRTKIDEMIAAMCTPNEKNISGVGLAANQIGIDAQILVFFVNYKTKKKQKILEMVNPEILEFSPQKILLEEGCLSLPEIYKKIWRPEKVRVRWQNARGNFCEKKFSGWDARIFLHEFDHLRGKLFVDYLKKF